mgnify:CR=1 FL=1
MIPAAYWVTNPYNIVRYNHAAGGEWFGFWYELLPFPEGPTANPNVHPEGQAMGKFEHNVAHCFVKYSFRGKTHIPRLYPENPERPASYENHNKPDYWDYNPSFEAKYYNFTAF